MFRSIFTIGFAGLLAACGSYEPYEASCLNGHVWPNYGSVREAPGGFEVIGSGPAYTPLEVTQHNAPLRPGTAGEPADDYPKASMRYFECRKAG